jgi:hypothetical protein
MNEQTQNTENLPRDHEKIKPIESKDTIEVIKFLAQYEKEKVYDSLSKIDSIRNTANTISGIIFAFLATQVGNFEYPYQKIVILIFSIILMFILARINWDITVSSGFSGKGIMEEIYDNPTKLKIDSFYYTKIHNKEELVWNYTLRGFIDRYSATETKIQTLFELRKALLITSSILIILALLFLSKLQLHINFHV